MVLSKIFRLFGELVVLLGVVACLIIIGGLMYSDRGLEESGFTMITKSKVEEVREIRTDLLNSEYALLVEMATNDVILDQRGSDKIYPASMTKVMTALVAIETLADLNEPIYLEPSIYPGLQAMNAAMAGFNPGQQVPAVDLLYGMMLASGAESTIALAFSVAGSEEGFVQLMNEKANELGLKGTHFTNASGFHHPEHYTTAMDMAKLMKYAWENQVLKELLTTPFYVVEDLTLESTLFSNLSRTKVNNGEIIGGKTGFTPEAGRCLVSLAQINEKHYILVTAGAENTPENQIQHLLDALYIYDQL